MSFALAERIGVSATARTAEVIDASVALPFSAPKHFLAPLGWSLADMLRELMARGDLDAAWLPRLDVYLDDAKIAPSQWAKLKPVLGQLVGVRPQPGWNILVEATLQLAVAIAVNALTQAFVGSGPQAQSFEQIKDIDASRNEIAPFRKVAAVLGTMRAFPCHAAKSYTLSDGEKVKLRMLLCWGLGPVSLDDLKIGDTALASFAGVTVQHKLAPGDAWPSLFPSSVDEDIGPGLLEYATGWVARTTTTDAAQQLQVEIAFPDGLIFYSSDGSIKSWGVHLRIRYRAEGASDWLDFDTGAIAAEGHLYMLSGYKKKKPFRMNFTRDVAPGRYEVAVKRAEEDDPGPKGHNAFQWTKLRSFQFAQPVLDDDLAITALEIEAGDQLEGQVDLINGVVTRLAPKWDSIEEEFGAEGPSSNPAELVRWIACGPGAAKPRNPATEIDEAAFGAWAELCEAKGWRCDMELRAGAGQDEIMETVARCGRGALAERGGKLTVIVDDVQAAPSQLFTARNCWGFRGQRRYNDACHALRCQFNNEEKDYVRDEMMVYYPGYDAESAEITRTVPMTGLTSPALVYAAGKRIIAEELLRVEDYVWRADMEHLLTQRGKRVKLAHPVIAVGITPGARVKRRLLNEAGTHVIALELDERAPQTIGQSYALEWRRQIDDVVSVETLGLATDPSEAIASVGGPTLFSDGSGYSDGAANDQPLEEFGAISGRTTFSDGSTYSDGAQNVQAAIHRLDQVVRLAAAGGVPLAAAPAVGDLVTMGEADIVTMDAIVTGVARASHLEAELSGAPYAEALFAGDLEELPEWSSNVTSGAFPAPPAPEIVGAAATASAMFVDFSFPLDTARRVVGIEAYWRDLEDDGEFELAAALPGGARLAPYPAGQRGRTYQLMLVALGARGQRVPSEIVELDSVAETPPFTGSLTQPAYVVQTAADGSGGDYGAAGGTFQLKVGDVILSPIVDPVDAEVAASFAVISATAGLFIEIDAEGVYTIADLTADSGQAVLRAQRAGATLDLVYSIAKAKTGGAAEPSTPPSGFVATIDLPSGGPVNLRSLADAAGYTGFSDATITFEIESGVTVTGLAGAPNGGAAIDTGEWPTAEYAITLDLVVKSGGQAAGGGGKGGFGDSNGGGGLGGDGGDALYCRAPIDVDVQTGGVLRGGGSGGGGGGAAKSSIPFSGKVWASGGGGGGGQPNGPGGARGQATHNGGFGTAGTTSAHGNGGNGGNYSTLLDAGDGGAGGDYGGAGANGQLAPIGSEYRGAGGSAGAAGYAVRKNGHTVNVTGSGSVVGSVG